jgi:phosphopantothenoylcysteine decarboxylase/phosphopantothenate--cysteine ligase
MDEDMWHHPSTKENLQKVSDNGCSVISVEHGELASGLIGDGRMAEPEAILEYLSDFFTNRNILKGKKALVTAGPTYEAIDPVRFIGNHSSGKMGYAIADELAKKGAEVTLVSGPVNIKPKQNNIKVVNVTSANQMFEACRDKEYNIAVMAAAVADFTPVNPSGSKIKKSNGLLNVELKETVDILSTFGKAKKEGQVLVGFALETNNEKENALHKLRSKNADMIVLNSLQDSGAGFGKDTNKITILNKDGSEKTFETKHKSLVAKDIVDAIIALV